MLRSARHAKILEIISRKEIETQEELCDELNALNYTVTQATISRDIRDFNDGESEISPKMRSLFRDCVVFVKAAKNLVVVKTLTGNGANAGAVVDKLNYAGIVGSVAGDDTLLIVCESDESALLIVDKINEFMK